MHIVKHVLTARQNRNKYRVVPFVYKFYDSDFIFKCEFFTLAKGFEERRFRTNTRPMTIIFPCLYLNGISLARLQQLASRINISAI